MRGTCSEESGGFCVEVVQSMKTGAGALAWPGMELLRGANGHSMAPKTFRPPSDWLRWSCGAGKHSGGCFWRGKMLLGRLMDGEVAYLSLGCKAGANHYYDSFVYEAISRNGRILFDYLLLRTLV